MKGEKLERWRMLCAQAAEEQDPDKLMELVREITQLLEEKEARLKAARMIPQGKEAVRGPESQSS